MVFHWIALFCAVVSERPNTHAHTLSFAHWLFLSSLCVRSQFWKIHTNFGALSLALNAVAFSFVRSITAQFSRQYVYVFACVGSLSLPPNEVCVCVYGIILRWHLMHCVFSTIVGRIKKAVCICLYKRDHLFDLFSLVWSKVVRIESPKKNIQ